MKYWIATDKKEIFHWGSFDPETQEFTTTQPFVLWYNTEEEQQAELDKLGVQWRQEKKESSLEDYLLEGPPIEGDK